MPYMNGYAGEIVYGGEGAVLVRQPHGYMVLRADGKTESYSLDEWKSARRRVDRLMAQERAKHGEPG